MLIPEKWPNWIVVPIALLMVFIIILVGLAVQPLVSAISPTPQATVVSKGVIDYSADESQACVDCHTNQENLAEVAADSEAVDRAYIDPMYSSSYHAQVGCVTCHAGNGEAETFGDAHVNLVIAPSYYGDPEVESSCITCHGEVSSATLNTLQPTTHDLFLSARHEDPKIDRCSNCHGQVAHGSNPFEMDAHQEGLNPYCMDCHVEQDVEPQLACADCHTDLHQIAADFDCSSCHASTELWFITEMQFDHPIPLDEGHSDVDCFECHNWPTFTALENATCADCHVPPHEIDETTQDCTICHNESTWQMETP